MATFPGASHTFTVTRRSMVAEGFNTVQGPWTPVATNVSVNLRPKTQALLVEGAGQTATSDYYGATWVANDIRTGDLLADETENDSAGNSVQYEVNGSDTTFAFRELQLHKTAIGS